eukprot:m.138538 g.138538  ORF g.138538 m.138538 type:complete len:217 (-) comp15212_c0_seq1:371-1021(-)
MNNTQELITMASPTEIASVMVATSQDATVPRRKKTFSIFSRHSSRSSTSQSRSQEAQPYSTSQERPKKKTKKQLRRLKTMDETTIKKSAKDRFNYVDDDDDDAVDNLYKLVEPEYYNATRHVRSMSCQQSKHIYERIASEENDDDELSDFEVDEDGYAEPQQTPEGKASPYGKDIPHFGKEAVKFTPPTSPPTRRPKQSKISRLLWKRTPSSSSSK